jgi:hypothetical protein
MSSHCTRPGAGAASLGVSTSTGSENAGASATGKASEIRVPKASGFVRSSIDVVSQSPTVYWQSGFARSALGSTVMSPLPLLRPLGIGCPAIAAKRSIVYGR